MRARLAPDVVRLIPSRLYGSLTCIFPSPGKMFGVTEVLVVKKEKKKMHQTLGEHSFGSPVFMLN